MSFEVYPCLSPAIINIAVTAPQTSLNFPIPPPKEDDNFKLSEAVSHFSFVLEKTLRLSDIIMQHGANSFFVMLTERTRSEAEGAINRIIETWKAAYPEEDVIIDHAFRYIDSSGDKQI